MTTTEKPTASEEAAAEFERAFEDGARRVTRRAEALAGAREAFLVLLGTGLERAGCSGAVTVDLSCPNAIMLSSARYSPAKIIVELELEDSEKLGLSVSYGLKLGVCRAETVLVERGAAHEVMAALADQLGALKADGYLDPPDPPKPKRGIGFVALLKEIFGPVDDLRM